MSIKADVWIKRMCSLPTFMVETQVLVPSKHSLLVATEKQIKPSWATREELEAIKQQYYSFITSVPSIDPYNFRELTEEEKENWKPMISPFEPEQVRYRTNTNKEQEKVISYGCSSYGYDIRLGTKFKVFTNINNRLIDPLYFDNECYVDKEDDHCIIPPNGFILASSIERICVPKNVLVICLGKSTYARTGAIVNVTPLEPGWEGYVTLEISNTTSLPLKVYANQGIAQLLFYESDEQCAVTYADRNGKYQNQESGPVPPKG